MCVCVALQSSKFLVDAQRAGGKRNLRGGSRDSLSQGGGSGGGAVWGETDRRKAKPHSHSSLSLQPLHSTKKKIRMSLRLKVTTPGKPACVLTVESGSTLSQFTRLVASSLQVNESGLALFVGFPPRPIVMDNVNALCSSLFSTGTVVEVRPQIPFDMVKYGVTPDGNCLFLSTNYLMEGTPPQTSDSDMQRSLVASVIISCPEEYTEGYLGMPPAQYVQMITKNGTWGGGIELAILSKAHECELFSVDICSGTVYRFGEEGGFKRRAFLLYDGLHYDPLIGKEKGQTLFPVGDKDTERALLGALKLAAELKASGKYTNLAGFSLRCSSCGLGCVGQGGAVAHAKETGHSGFFEYR
jgi:hypothetical protein